MQAVHKNQSFTIHGGVRMILGGSATMDLTDFPSLPVKTSTGKLKCLKNKNKKTPKQSRIVRNLLKLLKLEKHPCAQPLRARGASIVQKKSPVVFKLF